MMTVVAIPVVTVSWGRRRSEVAIAPAPTSAASPHARKGNTRRYGSVSAKLMPVAARRVAAAHRLSSRLTWNTNTVAITDHIPATRSSAGERECTRASPSVARR
jgi:hypothetical protein